MCANTFSSAAAVTNPGVKKEANKVSGLPETWIMLCDVYRAILYFLKNKSLSASFVWGSATTLFYLAAPEMVCGLQHKGEYNDWIFIIWWTFPLTHMIPKAENPSWDLPVLFWYPATQCDLSLIKFRVPACGQKPGQYDKSTNCLEGVWVMIRATPWSDASRVISLFNSRFKRQQMMSVTDFLSL